MKIATNIMIDAEVKEYFKQHNHNLSATCNNFLHSFIRREKGGVSALNIEIKRKELQKHEKNLAETQSCIQALKSEIELFDKKINDDEIIRMKKEKEIKEKETHCAVCDKCIKPLFLGGNKYSLCVDCLNSNFERKEDFLIEKVEV